MLNTIFVIMDVINKKIKTENIQAGRLITKSELARRQGVSHTEINRRINKGEFVVVITMDQFELVYL
jgi:DNA-binding GntR family transcriptional regulator